ncbi:ABC transporter permease [Burkholderia singularis]|nr:ABC transporter permease [Burkholderia singularis]
MSPFKVFSPLRLYRSLLWEMTKRDLSARYKGSYFGIFWAFLMPLAMLGIYSYVFGVVFASRWNAEGRQSVAFPIVLFAGLIVFNFLAECINRAPSLVTASPNLVKKSIFPLVILPWMAVFTATINAFISVAILLVGEWALVGHIPPTAVLFPLVLIPVALVALGIGWFLASLGVYVRDIAQLVGLVTTALLFLTPIFYPPQNAPGAIRTLSQFNPLAAQVQSMREVLLWGAVPSPVMYFVSIVVGWLVAWLGLIWFTRTSEGFADVL